MSVVLLGVCRTERGALRTVGSVVLIVLLFAVFIVVVSSSNTAEGSTKRFVMWIGLNGVGAG